MICLKQLSHKQYNTIQEHRPLSGALRAHWMWSINKVQIVNVGCQKGLTELREMIWSTPIPLQPSPNPTVKIYKCFVIPRSFLSRFPLFRVGMSEILFRLCLPFIQKRGRMLISDYIKRWYCKIWSFSWVLTNTATVFKLPQIKQTLNFKVKFSK